MAQMQFQEAKLGRVGQVVTYEVTDIPKEISDYRVIRQFNLTMFSEQIGRYSFQFTELGEGNHITQ